MISRMKRVCSESAYYGIYVLRLSVIELKDDLGDIFSVYVTHRKKDVFIHVFPFP